MVRIYILEGGAYSGGGEAMFQLGCDLLDRGYSVSLIDARKNPDELPPAKFDKYFEKGLRYCSLGELEDVSSNVVIVPESGTEYLLRFKKIKTMIYWLSYQNYDGKMIWNSASSLFGNICNIPRDCKRLAHFMKNVIKYKMIKYPIKHAVNLSGSHYATDELQRRGVSSVPLVHSIGVDFLEAGMYDRTEGRDDVVLYNPAKPSRLMEKLIRRGRFNYVPIQSLSVRQMIDLFRRSKVYVDFGNFPGPERLPKETVYNGVNVLVWALHAAKTDDVLIPDRYKLSVHVSPRDAEDMIGDMLNNYEAQNIDFERFRDMVQDMQSGYEVQLDQICKTFL